MPKAETSRLRPKAVTSRLRPKAETSGLRPKAKKGGVLVRTSWLRCKKEVPVWYVYFKNQLKQFS